MAAGRPTASGHPSRRSAVQQPGGSVQCRQAAWLFSSPLCWIYLANLISSLWVPIQREQTHATRSALVIPSPGNNTLSGRDTSIVRPPTLSSHTTLPHHGPGRLVIAQAKETGMTQFSINGPLRKADFGHELRPNPIRAFLAHRLRKVGTLHLERPQFRTQR